MHVKLRTIMHLAKAIYYIKYRQTNNTTLDLLPLGVYG